MICGIVLRGLWSIFGVKIAEFRMQFHLRRTKSLYRSCGRPDGQTRRESCAADFHARGLFSPICIRYCTYREKVQCAHDALPTEWYGSCSKTYGRGWGYCIPIRKTYLPLKTDWCKKGRENLCPVSPHSIFARSRHLFLFPKNSLSVGLIYGRRFMPVPTRSFLQRTCLRKKLYFIFHPNIDKTKIVWYNLN